MEFNINKSNSQKPDDNKNTISSSSRSIKKANIYILIASLTMITMFVIGVIISNKKPKNENIEEKKEEIQTEIKNKDDEQKANSDMVASIPPSLEIEKETIELLDIEVDQQIVRSTTLTVKDSPVKILSVKGNVKVPDLSIEQDCSEREYFDPNDQCTISVDWYPASEEDREFNISIRWIAYSQGTPKETPKEKTNTVKVILSSYFAEEEPEEEPEPEEEVYQEPEEEIIEDTFEDEPTTKRLNCKKYAAKARDFSGVLLGWVQSDMTVYNVNCSQIIGILDYNGDIIEEGTGEVIGRGPRLNGTDNITDERSIQALPVELEPVFESQAMSASMQDALRNRETIKFYAEDDPTSAKVEQMRSDKDQGIDPNRADDPLGVMGQTEGYFDSEDTTVSSLPGDELNGYIIRKQKPIPAVINTALRVVDGGSAAPCTATIERNIYGVDGRNIIIPAGSIVYGEIGDLIGDPSNRAFDRVNLFWNKIVRPDGAYFIFNDSDTFTGDAQGREGAPAKGDPQYVKRMITDPLMHSIFPALINMISPSESSLTEEEIKNLILASNSGDTSDIDYTAYADMGLSSKERAKKDIIENFKKVGAQALGESLNIAPQPYIVPAGTRITIFPQKDLLINFLKDEDGMNSFADPTQ